MTVDPSTLLIVRFPDPVLRTPAAAVEAITDEVRAVAARMLELTVEADGLGLAAPQVGLSWRMFVTRGVGEGEPDRVYINPRLVSPGRDTEVREEGCLSLPGITVDVRRPRAVTIEATGLDGAMFTITRDDLLARVWQHEVDHLDGRLIIDSMNPMDRLANRKPIKQLEAAAQKK